MAEISANAAATAAAFQPLDSKARKASTIMLILLAVSYALAYFDRMLMVVLGETIKGEFSLSDKELSLLTGAAFVLLYGATSVVMGWFLDRYNRKWILTGALVFWSFATMACGLARSFVGLATARAAVGVGEAANVPAACSIISDVYPPEKRPLATALFFAGGMLGILASFWLGSWLAETYGWRMVFFLAGPPGILLAILFAVLAREPARELAKTGIGSGEQLSARGQNSLKLIWDNKALVWLLAGQGIASFASVGMMAWLPMFFMRSHGLGMIQVGAVFGPALSGGMVLGMVLGGFLGNWVARKSVSKMVLVAIGAMFVLIPLNMIMLWTPSLTVALALVFLNMGIASAYTPITMAAWQTTCDPRARGTAAGITSLSSQVLGAAVCPFVIGALSDVWAPALGGESLRYALMASQVFCLLGAALFYYAMVLIRRNEDAARAA